MNAERYTNPLPRLTDEVATLATRVDEHLKKMAAWNRTPYTNRLRRVWCLKIGIQ